MAGYLGNTSNMIVHHLAMMKHECNIYDIEKKNKHYFIPDTSEQAKKEGFTLCKHCD
jgi:hypothetical protein